jgi:hypothetical protein
MVRVPTNRPMGLSDNIYYYFTWFCDIRYNERGYFTITQFAEQK